MSELNQGDQNQAAGDQQQAPADDANVLYTSDGKPVDVNALMAKHKRGVQGELKEAKKQLSEREQAFLRLKETVDNVTQGEDVDAFIAKRQEMVDLVSTLDSEQEKARKEAAKIQADLTQAQEDAATFRALYENSSVERDIRDAAPIGSRAYSEASQNLIVQHLKQHAKFDPATGRTAYAVGEADDDGNPTLVPASEAIAAMESDVKNFGPLFVATIKAGMDGDLVDGMKYTPEGGVNPEDLKDFQKYRELKRKNPAALEKTFGERTQDWGGGRTR